MTLAITVLIDLPPDHAYHRATLDAIRHAADAAELDVTPSCRPTVMYAGPDSYGRDGRTSRTRAAAAAAPSEGSGGAAQPDDGAAAALTGEGRADGSPLERAAHRSGMTVEDFLDTKSPDERAYWESEHKWHLEQRGGAA